MREGMMRARNSTAAAGESVPPDALLVERIAALGDKTALAELDARHGMTLYALAYSLDRKSTRLNSSHSQISYAVFCLKKKNIEHAIERLAQLGESLLVLSLAFMFDINYIHSEDASALGHAVLMANAVVRTLPLALLPA